MVVPEFSQPRHPTARAMYGTSLHILTDENMPFVPENSVFQLSMALRVSTLGHLKHCSTSGRTARLVTVKKSRSRRMSQTSLNNVRADQHS